MSRVGKTQLIAVMVDTRIKPYLQEQAEARVKQAHVFRRHQQQSKQLVAPEDVRLLRPRSLLGLLLKIRLDARVNHDGYELVFSTRLISPIPWRNDSRRPAGNWAFGLV